LKFTADPIHFLVASVMFLLLFVVPIYAHSEYIQRADETYTSNVLGDSVVVPDLKSDAASAAPKDALVIPGIGYEISTDFSDSGVLILWVGILMGVLAIVLSIYFGVGYLRKGLR